ncbi:hypothetical protein [Soonwooa purpurea]
MSYKKQQPKIADTLDIFIDRVEAIENSILKLKKLNENIESKNLQFNTEFEQKFTQLKQLTLKIDVSNLEAELKKIDQNLIDTSKEASLILNKEILNFEKLIQKISKYKLNYILIIAIIFYILSISSMFIAGKQYAEKIEEKEQKEHYMNFIRSNKEVLKLYNNR